MTDILGQRACLDGSSRDEHRGPEERHVVRVAAQPGPAGAVRSQRRWDRGRRAGGMTAALALARAAEVR